LILLYRVSVRALVLKYRRTRLNSEVYYSRNVLIVEKTHDSKRQKEGEKYLARRVSTTVFRVLRGLRRSSRKERVQVQTLWLENQSRQKWRPKQSAGEVARVDSERHEPRSSSQTKSELSRFEQFFFRVSRLSRLSRLSRKETRNLYLYDFHKNRSKILSTKSLLAHIAIGSSSIRHLWF